MKKLILLFVLIAVAKISYSQKPGQDKNNVDKWNFSVEQGSPGEATLVFKLKMDKGWHVYSQNTPDGGPLPMVYKFDPKDCYELIGKCIEPKPEEEYDSTFMLKVFIFNGEVTFRQKVKVKSNCKIHGTIEYQVCKDACIFKSTTFDLDVKK